jgi:hypothetical protein
MHVYASWFVPQEQRAWALVNSFRQETHALIRAIGPGRLNGTWLVQRFRHECSALDVPCTYLDFDEAHLWDYLSIVRSARDQMGAVHFNLLTRALNKIGTGVLPSLDEVDHLQHGDTLATQGRLEAERDDYVFVRARKTKDQRALEARVSLAFHTCLSALSAKAPLVFVLDSYEKATAGVDRWVRANLLTWVYEDPSPRLIVLVTEANQSTLGAGLIPMATFSHNDASLTEYVYLSELRPSLGPERSDDEPGRC